MIKHYIWFGIRDNKKVKGYYNEQNKDKTLSEIEEKKIKIIKIMESPVIFKKLSINQLYYFTKSLRYLLNSGIPIANSLEKINSRNKTLEQIKKNLIDKIKSGASIYESFLNNQEHFDNLYLSLIKAGEKTGSINKTFGILEKNLKKKIQFKKKITNIIIYPAVIISTAIMFTIFLINHSLPQMQLIYQNFNSELPFITELLLDFAKIIKQVDYQTVIKLIIIILIIKNNILKISKIKKIYHNFQIKFLFIKNIYISYIHAQFLRILDISLNNNLPIKDSIDICKTISTNYIFRIEIENIIRDINKGEAIHNAIHRSSCFSSEKNIIDMIKIGEETGNLSEIINNLANIYEEKTEYKLEMISNIIEPLCILLSAVFIGLLLIAMYLPIFKMTDIIYN